MISMFMMQKEILQMILELDQYTHTRIFINNGAAIILMSHLEDPKVSKPEFILAPVAKRLENYLIKI